MPETVLGIGDIAVNNTTHTCTHPYTHTQREICISNDGKESGGERDDVHVVGVTSLRSL